MSQEKTRSRDHDGFPWITKIKCSVGFRQRRYLELQIEMIKCILGGQIWPWQLAISRF